MSISELCIRRPVFATVLSLIMLLIGIVALATLGLAGAVRFSPHRGRAILASITLAVVSLATLWVLLQAFLFRSA